MLALSNRPVEEGWAGFGRIKAWGQMPPMKHGSQCLRAIISLGEAWLDTERAELVGVGSRGRKNRKDGASAPLCSGSGRRPYATHSKDLCGAGWSPGSSKPRVTGEFLALDGRVMWALYLSGGKFSSCSQKELGQVKGLMYQCSHISNFSIELLLLSSCLMFHYKMKIKRLAFKSNWLGFQSWVSPSFARLWANCVNFWTLNKGTNTTSQG